MRRRLWSLGGVLLLIPDILVFYPRGIPIDRRTHNLQRPQLNSIEAALDLSAGEFGAYPPSEANDVIGSPYCGAMKLAEAVMGRDLLGVHGDSIFRADGLDPNGVALRPDALDAANLEARHGPYLSVENADAYRLVDIYGKGKAGPFREDVFVLCDTFERRRPSGKKTGMPILYYRANPSGTVHDRNSPNNIYDYCDNAALIALGVPGDLNAVHPLAEPRRFYLNTQDVRVAAPTPVRRDSFILISAGYDGPYGTADDICNFEWRCRKSGTVGGAQK
jgi:hypothetical protein